MNFEILLQLLFKNEQNLKKRIKSDLQSQNKIKYPEYKKKYKKNHNEWLCMCSN